MKAILKINSSIIKSKENGSAFSFSFIDSNDKAVLRSETYKTKDSARKGIRAVKKNCTNNKRYIFKKSANEMFFFNLKSANGVTVATSAMFPDEKQQQDTIDQLTAFAPACTVEEQTTT